MGKQLALQLYMYKSLQILTEHKFWAIGKDL